MTVEKKQKKAGDEQRIYAFPNGWKASVIRNNMSYGHHSDLFELAVLNRHNNLNYSTSVTSDVEGHLTIMGVVRKLREIKALPTCRDVEPKRWVPAAHSKYIFG